MRAGFSQELGTLHECSHTGVQPSQMTVLISCFLLLFFCTLLITDRLKITKEKRKAAAETPPALKEARNAEGACVFWVMQREDG